MFDPSLQATTARWDRLQAAAVLGLAVLGALFVYSATMGTETSATIPLLQQSWLRQVLWYGVGLGLAVAVCLPPYHTLARWSLVAYWALVLLLAAVLVPGIGSVRYGARRWVDLGVFQFQPSEFAKLGVVLALAHFLSRPAEELKRAGTLARAVGMVLLPFTLILKEPDLGSAVLLIPTGLVMLYVAGAPRRFLAMLLGAVGLAGALLLADVLLAPPGWQLPLEEYQRHRLLTFFGRDFAPPNATPEQRAQAKRLQEARSYQVRQALISVGSGGLLGKGWRRGTQIALGFLPRGAAHNDFIFSVIAEEKGFVGSVTVLTLYAAILFSGLRIASQARDRLGKLLAVGVVTLLFSQVFINIGMNIRLMPVTGVPLPLLSYGGSSVVGSLIAMGLMQNVYIHRKGY